MRIGISIEHELCNCMDQVYLFRSVRYRQGPRPYCAHSGTVGCRIYNSIVDLFMIHEGNCHIPIFRPRICAIRISIHLDWREKVSSM